MTKPVNIPALAQSVQPTVQIENGQAITTSVEVARVFGKRHDDVLKAIRTLLPKLPADHLRNFAETEITRPSPLNGSPIKSPAYQLTRDGFTELAFGFNGQKAIAFRCAYIDAFNRMEAALLEQARIGQKQAVLGEAEKIQPFELGTLDDKICLKCVHWGRFQEAARAEVRRRLCERYQIARLQDLPRVHFQSALDWALQLKLHQPRPQHEVSLLSQEELLAFSYAASRLNSEIMRQITMFLLTDMQQCRHVRWQVSFVDDDLGQPCVPRVQVLPPGVGIDPPPAVGTPAGAHR